MTDKAARCDQLEFGRLQVIFKTVERCNLACDYCYYFFGGDESYRSRPPVVSLDQVAAIRDFLRAGCVDLGIETLNVVFHGGEPMLQKPRHFDAMCDMLRSLDDVTTVVLGMQTNGTIMSDEWVALIQKHAVSVGVSIDGNRELHDRHRRTVRGGPSYDLIVGNLDRFREGGVGSISVMNGSLDYRDAVSNMKDLGLDRLSFLLPDCSHDDGIPEGYSAEDYGRQLCDIFDASVEMDVNVREVSRVLEFFQEKVPSAKALERDLRLEETGRRYMPNQIVVVHSDGKLDIDDSYIPAQGWRGSFDAPHVSETTLRDYLNGPQFVAIDEGVKDLPEVCTVCEWRQICRGGDFENRWSSARGFDNPSVYCEGLKLYYAHVVRYLYVNGYPREKLLDKLGLDGEGADGV